MVRLVRAPLVTVRDPADAGEFVAELQASAYTRSRLAGVINTRSSIVSNSVIIMEPLPPYYGAVMIISKIRIITGAKSGTTVFTACPQSAASNFHL
ncbi:MAG TPA: hypothetical protein VGJ20_46455 [Xanthobacteraceae bacterium]|jgi:hypothetical protein